MGVDRRAQALTLRGIFTGALAGGAIAGIVNTVLYFIGKAAGAEYSFVQPGTTEAAPIPVFMPFVMSVMPALVLAVIIAVVIKVAPTQAWKAFVGLLVVGFVLMAPGPVMQLGHDMVAVVFLELMHVVEAALLFLAVRKHAED